VHALWGPQQPFVTCQRPASAILDSLTTSTCLLVGTGGTLQFGALLAIVSTPFVAGFGGVVVGAVIDDGGLSISGSDPAPNRPVG